MGRSEQRQKERAAAEARRNAPKPPTPAEAARPTNARDSRRGGGVRNRGSFQVPSLFAPSRIGGRTKPTGMPARDAGDANDGGGSLPLEVPSAPSAPAAPAVTAPVGAQRSVPDPAGTGATGTQTGFQGYNIDLGVADALLGRLNPKTGGKIADVNNFLSNDLPTVDISGSEFNATQRSDGTYNAPEKVVVGGKAVNFADLDGALSDTVVEGISTPGKTGISSADTADNNRSVSVPGEEPTDWSKPRQKSYSELRKEAFLDPNNRGYGAIRAADAAVGRFRQGDKFFVNDGGNLREINEDAWRTGQHRALSASEMKDAYVDSVKETLVPVATADAFDVGDTPITEAKQTTADYMGDIAETEFNMNNVAPGVSDRARMKGDYFNTGDDNDED